MLQKPNTVFVGKQLNANGAGLVVGDVVLIDAATGAPIAVADIDDAKEVQVGLVAKTGLADADADIKKTQVIGKHNITSIVYNAFSSKQESVVAVDLSGVTITPGFRYVLRLIYRDLYEHPGQFTHSYESIATTTSTVDSIGADIAAKINAHRGARATASYAMGTLVVTAKEITDNYISMMGKEGITPYAQVQMTAVLYHTIPGSAFSSGYRPVEGATITVIPSSPGKGNPYVIRDREQAALAYKGITYRTTWPIIKPELNVDLSDDYEELVVEFSKAYQSPDNQYVKSTDLAAEIYLPDGEDLADLKTAIAVWAGIEAPVIP